MKKILKAFAVAFSMYSKIPMPRFNWASEDMRYHLIFFPWVGAVIGVLEYLLAKATIALEIGNLAYAALAVVIPFLITGGFHFDGFMDACDALNSYQDKEKKLEIMKDPHIGAFAVISAIVYILLALAGADILISSANIDLLIAACFVFFIARALSAMSVVSFPNAKKAGMLSTESEESAKSIVRNVVSIELVMALGVAIYFLPVYGMILSIVMGLCYIYYYFMSKGKFGGITGDLAGYFVTIAELCAVMALAIFSLVERFLWF